MRFRSLYGYCDLPKKRCAFLRSAAYSGDNAKGEGTTAGAVVPSPLAFPSGFEPLTFRLGGGRSILLSYGNIASVIVSQRAQTIKRKNENFS